MQTASEQVTQLARSVVEPMGYELVGVEYQAQGPQGAVLRVYIDHENGITLDDCSAVSHQFSGVLDVEDPIRGNYSLEVSSPGLDRPLFSPAHFERFAGEMAKIRLRAPLEGRKRFKGQLLGRDGDRVLLLVDGERYELPLADIEQANLVAQF